MIAWLRKAWRWIALVAVAVVSALVPGVLWWRERKRRQTLEETIELHARALEIEQQATRAKAHAVAELTRQLDALRTQAAEDLIRARKERVVLSTMPEDDAWDRAFGRPLD